MRRRAVMVASGLMLAASVAVAGPASAAVDPVCVGTDGTIVVCVDPDGATYYSDCIYTGGPTCTPVTVLGPSITCGGRFGPTVCADGTLG